MGEFRILKYRSHRISPMSSLFLIFVTHTNYGKKSKQRKAKEFCRAIAFKKSIDLWFIYFLLAYG